MSDNKTSKNYLDLVTEATTAQPLTADEIEAENLNTVPDVVDTIETISGESLSNDTSGEIPYEELDEALSSLQNEDEDIIDDNLYESAPDPSQAE